MKRLFPVLLALVVLGVGIPGFAGMPIPPDIKKKPIITIPKPHASVAVHPTEKPVELAEYLIKSFTAVGDTVLDCCMGVGWTAIACKKLNRNFIGIELNPDYVKLSKERILANGGYLKTPGGMDNT